MSSDPQEHVGFVIVLNEARASEIHDIATAASDPRSPRYGSYVSRRKLHELAHPDPKGRQHCLDWFAKHGMQVRALESPQRFSAIATQEQVAKAFPDWATMGNRVTQGEWYLPGDIAGFVKQMLVNRVTSDGAMGSPGSKTSSTGIKHAAGSDGAPEGSGKGNGSRYTVKNSGMSPADIARFYDFPKSWDGTGETVVLLARGVPSMDDLSHFWKHYKIDRPLPKIVNYPGHHVTQAQTSGGISTLEITMNVQWLGAMAPGAEIIVLNVDASGTSDPWSTTLGWALGEREMAPTIVVTTYTTPAGPYYETHGKRAFRDLLDQAAAVGVTVVSASGDWGVYDGRPSIDFNGVQVCHAAWPASIFPASQKRVLAVGGTMVTQREPHTELGWSGLPPPDPRLRGELPLTLLASTGGFSDMVAMPEWQKRAILARKMYSRGSNTPAVAPYGRGYPDVALAAQGPLVQGPGNELVPLGYHARFLGVDINYAGGTSVAAPIWGAIIARWNEARRAEGLPRVGSVNPLLYMLAEDDPEVFRRICVGNSDVEVKIVNGDNEVATYRIEGYENCDGWNPVTGLGVPRVQRMIESPAGKLGKVNKGTKQ